MGSQARTGVGAQKNNLDAREPPRKQLGLSGCKPTLLSRELAGQGMGSWSSVAAEQHPPNQMPTLRATLQPQQPLPSLAPLQTTAVPRAAPLHPNESNQPHLLPVNTGTPAAASQQHGSPGQGTAVLPAWCPDASAREGLLQPGVSNSPQS